ncbi:MAG: formylglycine-generating enzyme family protein, partial [Candidatus Kapaibacterium sp.]
EMTAKNLPVAGIEWAEAALFCNELSKIEGRDTCYIFNGGTVEFDTSSAGWRLPTEAEWEYLCRGGSDGDFAGPGNPDEMGWYSANSGYRAQPVAEKSANAWGIHDMHGNLWEWCWDYYSADYYEQSAPIDPLGPESGSRRVLRGGSYADGLALMRSANRRANDIPKEHCGIRIVRFTD